MMSETAPMTRETRFNLIFLAVILAILTPGGVILFRKKLEPTLRPMSAPHAVQREHAYLSPLATPPGRKRVEPPYTAKWIESLVRERIGERKVVRPTAPDGLPLVSDKKTFELIALEPGEGTSRAWVLLWQADEPAGDKWSLDGAPSSAGEVRVVSAATLPVPPFVREELGETGVLRPPHEVQWQELEFTRPAASPATLRRGSSDFVNFVPSFTNSGATTP